MGLTTVVVMAGLGEGVVEVGIVVEGGKIAVVVLTVCVQISMKKVFFL